MIQTQYAHSYVWRQSSSAVSIQLLLHQLLLLSECEWQYEEKDIREEKIRLWQWCEVWIRTEVCSEKTIFVWILWESKSKIVFTSSADILADIWWRAHCLFSLSCTDSWNINSARRKGRICLLLPPLKNIVRQQTADENDSLFTGFIFSL